MRRARELAGRGRAKGERVPDFELDDPAAVYVFFVHIIGLSEAVFLDADVSFTLAAASCKSAYDEWRGAALNRG